MCNYENKNDDRRVLTQRNAARYGKEETVKIPAYYQMIGVNAFQSNIKMKNLAEYLEKGRLDKNQI